MPSPLIIAHRGASAEARENTIAAFERAIALGADLIELDVRCTSDQVLIVHHDPEIQHQAIQNLTWAEVQAIDIEVPRFDQVLACCQGRIGLDVEIKESGYEAAVLKALDSSFSTDEYVITSFDLNTIDCVKQLNLGISVGLLLEPKMVNNLSKNEVNQLKQKIKTIGVNFLAPNWQVLNSWALSALSIQNSTFWIWTINDPIMMQKMMLDLRISGIITDKPNLALDLRDLVF